MKKIKPKKGEKDYIFKVSVSKESPVLYRGRVNNKIAESKFMPHRKVGILGSQNLYNLAEIIIKSFDFDFDHCFGFFNNIKDPYKSNLNKSYELFTDIPNVEKTGSKSVKKTKIYQAWKKEGEKMMLLFDYGDDWNFLLRLEEIKDVNLKKSYPVILEKIGESPEQYPDCEG